jgi:glycosyltransferase involved in cell wall biosynthesis
MKPFFSVVTEVYNRKNTIKKTIDSVMNQLFTDFEYVIVDSGSTDGSRDLVLKIVSEYNDNRIFYLCYPFEENEIARWNYPLNHCSGRYVVVLEGDDWFDSGYLKKAHERLIDQKIGIYVGKRSGVDSVRTGYINNNDAINSFRMLEFCPPPSEAIFIRTHGNHKFQYDAIDYVWAAEYSLYDDILVAGYDIFVENSIDNCSVHRGLSYRLHSSKHLHDVFLTANKNKIFLNEHENRIIQEKLAYRVGKTFAEQILQFRLEKKLLNIFLTKIFEGLIYITIRSFIIHFIQGLKSKLGLGKFAILKLMSKYINHKNF